jgi:hypothetical protein
MVVRRTVISTLLQGRHVLCDLDEIGEQFHYFMKPKPLAVVGYCEPGTVPDSKVPGKPAKLENGR